MLTPLEPEDYDPRHGKWSMATCPMSTFPFGANLRRMRGGMHSSRSSSPCFRGQRRRAYRRSGEEGQLSVDEILAYVQCLPVLRLLINDNKITVARRRRAALRDNRVFADLSAVTEARRIGDQLYGINMTRGYTLAAHARGHQGVVGVGRIQTRSSASFCADAARTPPTGRSPTSLSRANLFLTGHGFPRATAVPMAT